MKFIKTFMIRINDLVRRYIFSRPKFIRLVFSTEVVACQEVQRYCSWGTVAFRFVLKRHIQRGYRILEIGTGAHAVLAVFVKKCFPDMSVVGTDILPERVSIARKTAAKNDVDIEFVVSDMFEEITECFDLIIFNPPLTPNRLLEKRGFAPKEYPGLGSRRSWSADGGFDGLDMVRAFLDGVGEHLVAESRAMISINPLHCSVDRFNEFCKNAGLTVEYTHRFPGITNVYVLRGE
jgi:methylase of polypeptide subunit release factors